MPILVKDYEWAETPTTVHITVPLKGVKSSKVDLINTDEFLKANFPPFLFEILLYDKVLDEKSNAKIREGLIEFNLTKQRDGIWGTLTSPKSEDKVLMLEKKKEVVEYVRKRTEEETKEKMEKKNKNRKYALGEMMKLENRDRERIENVKESERIKAVEDMEEWKKEKQAEEEKEKRKLDEERMIKCSEYAGDDDDPLGGEKGDGKKQMKKEIFEDDDVIFSSKEQIDHPSRTEDPSSETVDTLPQRKSGPRTSGKISFAFTPRVFPTPLRESKTLEEEEWLRNQAEARKISAVDDPDLKEHEKDPEWLKDKGNKLFASGNYLAAVNAYNLAIRIQRKKHVLYLNRAACHLKLRNLYKCIEDCSSALELLIPPVLENAKARLKSHIRRGTAFCELELYAEGLQEYMAAIKIEPDNEELKQDAEKIRQILQSGDEMETETEE